MECRREIDLEKEGFGDIKILHPAEIARGVTLKWNPEFKVVVPGLSWTNGGHEWLVENARGLWRDRIFQPQWLVGFELEDDAIWFKMVWG